MRASWRPSASEEVVRLRASLLHDIRAFLDRRGVLEVETPLMSSAATTDPNLASFSTRFRKQSLYLNTSPEYCMKRLLAEQKVAIYQICKSFRADELGPTHNPEFTLLEWYQPGYDMHDLMSEVADLVLMLFDGHGSGPVTIKHCRYAELFLELAGLNPHRTTADVCRSCAVAHGIRQPVGLSENVDEWLDWLLIELIVPSFPNDGLTFIYDFPESQAALARCYRTPAGELVAARFEMFAGQVELANGFDELLDVNEQRRRFERENLARIGRGLEPSVIDENFLSALEHGLPDCSGVAVGLDRLLMVLTGAESIDQVLAFSFESV